MPRGRMCCKWKHNGCNELSLNSKTKQRCCQALHLVVHTLQTEQVLARALRSRSAPRDINGCSGNGEPLSSSSYQSKCAAVHGTDYGQLSGQLSEAAPIHSSPASGAPHAACRRPSTPPTSVNSSTLAVTCCPAAWCCVSHESEACFRPDLRSVHAQQVLHEGGTGSWRKRAPRASCRVPLIASP